MEDNNNILAEVLGSLMNNKDGNFLGNSGFMWVIFMFFMLFWGGGNGFGNGFWGGNRGFNNGFSNSVAWQQTQDSFRDVIDAVNVSNASLTNSLNGIDNDVRANNALATQLGYNLLEQSNSTNQQIAQQGFNLQTAIMAGNNLINGAICQLNGDTQLAICQSTGLTQNAIRDVGFGTQTAIYQSANQINSSLQKLNGDTQLSICQSNNGIQSAINANSNALQNTVRDVGNSALQGITALGFLNQQKSDEIKYELARSTNAITANNTNNTQKVLDKLCSMEASMQAQRIQELQIQNQALVLQNQVKDLQAGQLANTGFIINQLRPYPIPAYTVSSPYGTTTTTPTVTG